MKKYILSTAVALTATVALAASINIAKVNTIISDILKYETTELISDIQIVFDERTNLDSLEDLAAGVKFSATATQAKWSKSPSSLDINLGVRNLEARELNSKLEFEGTLGSKTDSVALYKHIATQIAKDETAPEDESEKELREWAKVAAQTQKLDQIPQQLEKLVVIIKKAILEDTAENEKEGNDNAKWAQLMDSLVVDTKIHNYETVGVVLKTTKVVEFSDVTVSNLALNISKTGISFDGRVSLDVKNEYIEQFAGVVANYLSAIENADSETLDSLREMARSYIQMAESALKDDL